MAVDKGKVERARLLLEELADALGQMEREIDQRWRGSTAAAVDVREQAYHDWCALQRLRRLLTNVLVTDNLEASSG